MTFKPIRKVTFKLIRKDSWCPECGPDILVDDDELCYSCGATCTGPGAEKALQALGRQKTPAETAVLRAADRLATNGTEWKPKWDAFCLAVDRLRRERKRKRKP